MRQRIVRKRTKLAAVAAVGALVITMAAGCGGSSSGGGGSKPASAGGPQKGGTLNILSQADSIAHLDPQRNYVGEDFS
ncbi:MAG: hypothetical protein FWD74_09710, partial [Actinomycetia bacterium]|nr:hypothetical protein [Actinomycetes bacterium]